MSEEEVRLYPWRKNVKPLPSSLKTPIEKMIQIGHIPQLSISREKTRETLGIASSPPTAYQKEEARTELQDLVKQTDLYRKAVWNPKKIKQSSKSED